MKQLNAYVACTCDSTSDGDLAVSSLVGNQSVIRPCLLPSLLMKMFCRLRVCSQPYLVSLVEWHYISNYQGKWICATCYNVFWGSHETQNCNLDSGTRAVAVAGLCVLNEPDTILLDGWVVIVVTYISDCNRQHNDSHNNCTFTWLLLTLYGLPS